MLPHRCGDFRQIRGKPLHDARRRREVTGKPRRHRDARRRIDRFEKAQRKLRVVTFFLARMLQLLHVKIGKDAQQARAHVDAAAQAKIAETVEARRTP